MLSAWRGSLGSNPVGISLGKNRLCHTSFLEKYRLSFPKLMVPSYQAKMVWRGDSGVRRIRLLSSDSLVTDGPELGQQGQED